MHSGYPSFQPTTTIAAFRELYGSLESGARLTDTRVTIAGRIVGKREAGKRLVFYDLECSGERLQLLVEKKYFDETGSADFRHTNQSLRRGDIIGADGFPGVSGRGELSLIPRQLRLLAPCLHPLPTQRQPMTDPNLRYRQRYVDMLVNPDSTTAWLRRRAAAISFIRRFLESRQFVEVETPILSHSSGGANANPFLTHSVALDAPLQLRVAPELFLKQLLVGGLDRVFEIGKVFRNERLSPVHAPEFTTCELYMAFSDHEDLISLTEEMLPALVNACVIPPCDDGNTTGNTGNKATVLRVPTSLVSADFDHKMARAEDDTVEIDFTPPFARLEVMPALRERVGAIPPASCPSFHDRLFEVCVEHDIMPAEPRTTGRLLDALIGHFLEPECLHPTFITGHPAILSPLAKRYSNHDGIDIAHDTVGAEDAGDNGHGGTVGVCSTADADDAVVTRVEDEATERFELFIGGREIINAYSELNDPHEQRRRFAQQMADRAEGDVEGMATDDAFCRALEYGMPPSAGWGVGVDRLCMLLCGATNIRDVQTFPTLSKES